MYYSSVVIALACFLNTITAIGFTGQFKNIPNDVPELAKELRQTIPNLNNYPLRFMVDLYRISDKGKNHNFRPISAIVDQNYQFKYKDLANGEYELIANSYDFTFTNNRFKIIVDDGKIVACESYLDQEQSNSSEVTEINHQTPLEIEFKEVKQFYEKSGGTVYDMLLNSPFGFIFKNKTYTIIFIVVLTISVAPTVAQWINPEFVEQFKEVQVQAAQLRLEKSDVAETQDNPIGVGSTGAKKSSGSVKKRR